MFNDCVKSGTAGKSGDTTDKVTTSRVVSFLKNIWKTDLYSDQFFYKWTKILNMLF